MCFFMKRRFTMKINKNRTTAMIMDMGELKGCIKLEMQNIVFPKWSDLGLAGMMIRQCVSTKEQPTGNIYDEAIFQVVLRVIGGKVLMNGRPDCYCWKHSKVENAKNTQIIGTNSATGLINLCGVLDSVVDATEKSMLADMFANLKKDLLLVTTPAENRICIEVTADLYNAGITHCVDEWMDTDESGNAEATELQIGDFMIVTNSGVYRVGRDEFLETHVIN